MWSVGFQRDHGFNSNRNIGRDWSVLCRFGRWARVRNEAGCELLAEYFLGFSNFVPSDFLLIWAAFPFDRLVHAKDVSIHAIHTVTNFPQSSNSWQFRHNIFSESLFACF